MKYYINKIVDGEFDEVIQKVTESLATEGFGVLTEIDISATLKKKIDVDFRPYKILGACNPHFAHEALKAEDKVGTMLPCSVVVQELEKGKVEVASIDPMASMQAIDNEALKTYALQVKEKLTKVIEKV